MLKVIAEQEHYLLISDGQDFTVVERRAGNSTRCAQASDTGSILAMRPSPS
jgi:hypothetical protein